MLVYSHTGGVGLLTWLAKQFAARRSVVPLLHIDANQIEESSERLDNSDNVVCVVQLVPSVRESRRGQQLREGEAVWLAYPLERNSSGVRARCACCN